MNSIYTGLITIEMEKSFIRNYLTQNGKYFPSNKLNRIGEILEYSSISEYSINKRFFNPILLTMIFWLFPPFQLFDRIVLRNYFWGILKLLTLPTLFIIFSIYSPRIGYTEFNDPIVIIAFAGFIVWSIWTIVDGFTIYSRTKYANYNALLSVLNIKDDNYVVNEIKTKEKSLNQPRPSFKENLNIPNQTINEMYKRKSK